MVTPVPIPNTEVKHFSGEYSYACHSETSTSPGFLESPDEEILFLFHISELTIYTKHIV